MSFLFIWIISRKLSISGWNILLRLNFFLLFSELNGFSSSIKKQFTLFLFHLCWENLMPGDRNTSKDNTFISVLDICNLSFFEVPAGLIYYYTKGFDSFSGTRGTWKKIKCSIYFHGSYDWYLRYDKIIQLQTVFHNHLH